MQTRLLNEAAPAGSSLPIRAGDRVEYLASWGGEEEGYVAAINDDVLLIRGRMGGTGGRWIARKSVVRIVR